MAAFEANLSTGPRHCEEYLDDPTQLECLRRFLDYHCRPAALKWPTGRPDFDRGLEERLGMSMWRDPVPMMFARHEGKPVRVTMASRFGGVGITEGLAAEHGYGKRVAVEDLTDFSATAPEPIIWIDCAPAPWGGGFVGNAGNRAAARRHYEGLTQISRPLVYEGNRAQRRAAAAAARRRA